MAELAYTFYPKDWAYSDAVFQLNLADRGLYRELIDMAMMNDNKVQINEEIWARKFGSARAEIKTILEKLKKLELIKIDGNLLTIPSCESRLEFVRKQRANGAKGGRPKNPKKTQTITQTKPKSNPNESHKDKDKDKDKEIGFLKLSEIYGKWSSEGELNYAEGRWNDLPLKDQKNILKFIPKYKSAFPDPKHRLNLSNFLIDRKWEDKSITWKLDFNDPNHKWTAQEFKELSKEDQKTILKTKKRNITF